MGVEGSIVQALAKAYVLVEEILGQRLLMCLDRAVSLDLTMIFFFIASSFLQADL